MWLQGWKEKEIDSNIVENKENIQSTPAKRGKFENGGDSVGSIINERTSNDGMARAKLLKLLNELKNLVVPPKTISNSDLIDYIQLIQEIIMDDFPEEETRRMCFKAIDSIEKSVINAGK